MRSAFGLLSIVFAVAIGLFVYRTYFTANQRAATLGTNNARAVADVTGVEMDLNSMAEAERSFQALNGRFATLQELQSNGDLAIDPSRGRLGYTYSADVAERTFKITAAYSGPATGMPTLSIDQMMGITSSR